MKALSSFCLSPRSQRSISGSRNGVALLVVLAFIVLLSVLVASYLSFSGLDRLSTASYSKSIQAQEIAQGGLQDIIADLHQEIVAGSLQDDNPAGAVYTVNGVTAYIPTNNVTAQPARMGFPATAWTNDITASQFSPSLVRVSRADPNGATALDFASGTQTSYYDSTKLPLNRASAAHTDTASVNGRYISTAVWNKSALLAAPGAAVPSAFSAPDWIYTTRNGSRVCTAGELSTLKPNSNVASVPSNTAGANPPASPVTGRYAYIIYDEGALLDANVAGYPAAAATTTASYTPSSTNAPPNSQVVRGKSYTSYADLTQLPGMTQGTVDSLVGFRDAGGVSYASASGTGTPFLGAVFNYAQNGFLQFLSSGGANSVSDSPLLNRQDLLNYIAKIDPNNSGAAKALPYLGTYSRAVSAPSYFPPLDAKSIPNYTSSMAVLSPTPTYHTSMETSGIVNRDLANVRFSNNGTATILHYLDNATTVNPDGTTSSYTATNGDPLLQNRFSLARIGWLSAKSIGGSDPGPGGANPDDPNSSPSPTAATAIKSCFGLQWGLVGPVANGGNPCWKYVGSSGNFNGTIETLDQVALENREPNFFELLKAAILSGSVGVSPGKAAWNNGAGFPNSTYTPFTFKDNGLYNGGCESVDCYSYLRNGNYPAPQGIPDVQIIKIGADIIDQYDTDSYPTAIYFPYQQIAGSPYDAANFNTFANGGAGDFNGPSDMIYGDENVPSLTGFYQMSGTDTATTTNSLSAWLVPQLWNPHQEPQSTLISATQKQTIPSSFSIKAYGQAYINWEQENPYSGSGDTTTTQLDNDTINITDSNPSASTFYSPSLLTSQLPGISVSTLGADSSKMAPSAFADYTSNSFIGFWIGNDSSFVFLPEPAPPAPKTQIETRFQTAAGVTMSLGWVDSHNGFHPYSYLCQDVGYSYSLDGPEEGAPDEHGSAKLSISDAEFHCYQDPRTYRFSNFAGWSWMWANSTAYAGNPAVSSDPLPDNYGQGRPIAPNFYYNTTGTTAIFEDSWMTNSPNTPGQTGFYQAILYQNYTARPSYYADPDGVIRPGDCLYGNDSTGDGMFLYTQPGSSSYTPPPVGDLNGNVQHGRRPVILNRPFLSVGELGYVYRDLPFKTLDFFSSSSADAALLDMFSLMDESKCSNSSLSSVVAGQINLSNSSIPVLQSLLSGGSKKLIDPSYNLGTEASSSNVLTKLSSTIGQLINPVASQSPLVNRAALVTQIQAKLQSLNVLGKNYVLINSTFDPTDTGDISNKAYQESTVRALANSANTRTWNFFIDVIAQSGHLANNAATLDNFFVDGERRYWLHLAIDRYTGKVISQQIEPVYE